MEQDDTPERVRHLVEQARSCGLGLLRIFLNWPWIESAPGTWDFGIYDEVFAAAACTGVRIKATLTPDSGPWHAGTPGLVQSGHITLPATDDQRTAMRRYIESCARRYCGHPALAQWILWNEARNPVAPPGQPDPGRGPHQRRLWTEILRKRYADDIGLLNRRWLTGYAAFEDVDLPGDVVHPAHREAPFFSFGPWLADYRLRASALYDELCWVRDVIRSVDAATPVCLNPPSLFSNHAGMGYDLAELSTVADVLGASIHAPWHLGFAPRPAHLPLIVAGVGLLRQASGIPVELTEHQLGNVYHAAPRPLDMPVATLAASYLAPLLSGAETVTGWCLNSRQRDGETGDWALLDDDDRMGDRARILLRVRDCLGTLGDRIGDWAPAAAEALVLFGEQSQAVQLAHGWTGDVMPGRDPDDAIQGVGLLATELLRLGITAAPAPVSVLERPGPLPQVLVISHLAAWSRSMAQALLERVRGGAFLLLDGTSGHTDLDAGLHRPWPGILSRELGFRVTGLRTRAEGHPVQTFGQDAGTFPLVHAEYEFTDPTWRAEEFLRLPDEAAAPCVWRRGYGDGQIVLVSGPVGPALVHDERMRGIVRQLLALTTAGIPRAIRPLTRDTITLRVHGTAGEGVGVFAPAAASAERRGQPVRVSLRPGTYDDLWSGTTVEVGPDGESGLPAEDGIAILTRRLDGPAG